jgi:hypothetical protein
VLDNVPIRRVAVDFTPGAPPPALRTSPPSPRSHAHTVASTVYQSVTRAVSKRSTSYPVKLRRG